MGGRNGEAVFHVIILIHPIVITRRLVHITGVARRGRRAGGRGGRRGRGTGIAIVEDRHGLLLLLLLLHLSRGEDPLNFGHGLTTGGEGRRCCAGCLPLAVVIVEMVPLSLRKGHGGVKSPCQGCCELLVVLVHVVNGLNLGVAGTAGAEDAILSLSGTHWLGGRPKGGVDVGEGGLTLSVIICAVDVEHRMLLALLVAVGVVAVGAAALRDGLG